MGILVAGFGLSAFIVTTLFEEFYEDRCSIKANDCTPKRDFADYFVFLAIALGAINLLAIVLLRKEVRVPSCRIGKRTVWSSCRRSFPSPKRSRC